MSELAQDVEWYMGKNGKSIGPITADGLILAAREGRLVESDLIWCSGMPEWVEAGTHPDLFGPPPLPQCRVPSAARQMRRKPGVSHRRRRKTGPEDTSGDERFELAPSVVLDIEAGIDPPNDVESNVLILDQGRKFFFKNWPMILGSLFLFAFSAFIMLAGFSEHTSLGLYWVGSLVATPYLLGVVNAEIKGGLMTCEHLTFPGSARVSTTPFPIPFRQTVLICDIWEAASDKDRSGWYVDLSGEFGGRTVRLASKGVRDQFYAELRRFAPNIRVYRGR